MFFALCEKINGWNDVKHGACNNAFVGSPKLKFVTRINEYDVWQ